MDLLNGGYILPSNVPNLATRSHPAASFLAGNSLNRGILQERSANRRDEHPGYYHIGNDSLFVKAERPWTPQSPFDGHGYYAPGQPTTQSLEREAWVMRETKQLYDRALNYPSYHEYRVNQRKRELTGAKGANVWTEPMEVAFWKGECEAVDTPTRLLELIDCRSHCHAPAMCTKEATF